jgi:hypothetical protein
MINTKFSFWHYHRHFLDNDFFCNFNKTLQGLSEAQVLAHIPRFLMLNDFLLNYGPCLNMRFVLLILCVFPVIQ